MSQVIGLLLWFNIWIAFLAPSFGPGPEQAIMIIWEVNQQMVTVSQVITTTKKTWGGRGGGGRGLPCYSRASLATA